MPVDESFKDDVRRRNASWKEKMLQRYAPIESLESLDLNDTRFILQRVDFPYSWRTTMACPVYAWTVEKRGHKREPCILITETSTVWDAEYKELMLLFNTEFTIYDAEGPQLQTIIELVDKGKRSTRIPVMNERTFYVDSYAYAFGRSQVPVPEILGQPAWIVVREDNEERWFVPRGKDHYPNVELIDREGNLALRINGLSFIEKLWQGFSKINSGPRHSLYLEVINKAVPKEVVLYLASQAIRGQWNLLT